MPKAHILIVEDDWIVAEDTKITLKKLGFGVSGIVTSGEESLERVEAEPPDLVLMDIKLEGEMGGIEAAARIRDRFNIPVVYVTGYADEDVLERAKVTEPFGYIVKPFDDRELNSVIEIALYKHKMETKLKESEAWLYTTLKSIGDAVITTDTKGIVTFMNPVAQSLTGWRLEEAMGRPLTDVFNIINEETRKEVENPAARVLIEGKVVNLANHTLLIAKSGTEIPIDDSGAPIVDEKGDIIGVVLVFRDVGEKRDAEKALRMSDNIVNASNEHMSVIDRNYIYQTANDAYLTAHKKTRADIVGHSVADLLGQDVFEKSVKGYLDRCLSGETVEYGRWFDFPGTGHRYMDVAYYPFREKGGRISGVVVCSRDRTQQKRSDDVLAESNERLITVLDSLDAIVYVADMDTHEVLFLNEHTRKLFDKDMTGEVCWQVLQGDQSGPCDFCTNKYLTDTGGKPSGVYVWEHYNPALDKTYQCHDQAIQWIDGRTVRLEIATDITVRKQLEEALRSEKDFTQSLIDTAQTILLVLNTEGRIVRFNPFMENLCGYKLDEVRGTDWFSTFLPEQNRNRIKELFRTAVTGNETQGNIDPIVAKDGREIIVEWYDKTLKDDDGKTIGLLCIGQDITSRMQAEEALRESEERYRTVADFAHDWEYWVAPDGRYLYVSPSCERVTGYRSEDFINDPGLLEKIVHPDDHSDIADHFQGEVDLEKLHTVDFRIITRSGEERWINHVCQVVYGTNGAYLGRRGSNRDITKQKKMQEELLKAKKLESVGVLAGGIAHDFNNLMSVVVGNISLARTEMRPGSKGFKNLVEAEKASIQTTALTSRLITFSKGGRPVKEPVSIGDLVKNSVDSSLKGSDISCIFSVPEDILPAEVDEEQMKQVIHNIVTNAQEAMAEQGTINVSCGNVIVGEKDTLNLKDGKYVKISIEDQGPGIPEKDLINIFDPYFSTKEMGTQKGMGLGLAVSDSIVKQHDGVITVESKLGTGTTFSIYLPASEKEIVGATPVKKPAPGISESKGEKILVMDDEAVVRDVSNALLTHLGYEVEVAVDGVEAIELYKKAIESEKPFDMVILDLTNKVGMGGAETIVNLLEIDPDVKAIVASGYSNDPLMSNFREHGFRAALPKPFNLA